MLGVEDMSAKLGSQGYYQINTHQLNQSESTNALTEMGNMTFKYIFSGRDYYYIAKLHLYVFHVLQLSKARISFIL